MQRPAVVQTFCFCSAQDYLPPSALHSSVFGVFFYKYLALPFVMSYRGRPSKGCESCRARKVRVSQAMTVSRAFCQPLLSSTRQAQHTGANLPPRSATRQSHCATAVAKLAMSANIATRPTSFSAIRQPSLPKEQRSRGGRGQSPTNEVAAPAMPATHLPQTMHRRHSLTARRNHRHQAQSFTMGTTPR